MSLWEVAWRNVPCALGMMCCLIAACTGCGDSGPPRYNLSGKVTYGGQPIPKGSITFMPDSTLGNSGMAASVEISDGEFDTSRRDQGHVGGPHVVKITGLDGKASPEFPNGVPMFPDFEIKIDLPKEESTKDFEVPADWVNPAPAGGAAPTA